VRGWGDFVRASAPGDEAYALSASYRIPWPDGHHEPGAGWLRLHWVGDVARAMVGGRLIADCFWSSRPWEIDLGALETDLAGEELIVELLPLRADSPVHLSASVRPDFEGQEQILRLDAVEVIARRTWTVDRAVRNPAPRAEIL
jgi:beta-galactosidase